jgi:sterol desaturase/sphingolipid hydroxylase (fatty acid hydroxylase superfamily)
MNVINKKKEKQIKKKKKKEEIERKEQEIKKEKEVKIENQEYYLQMNALFRSISNNYIFFITLFYCLYKLKQNPKYNSSYIKLLFSFITVSVTGYFVHFISHHINFTNYHKQNNNILTRNSYINYIIKFICNFFDFHDITHHDTSINKQILNIIYEFLNNVIMQGLGLVIFIKMLDIRVIILWAFMYATIHNINYLFIKPSTHRDHHINNHTNYGIDYCDILFNTKYDWNDIETHNHGAINLLVVTYIIMYFT